MLNDISVTLCQILNKKFKENECFVNYLEIDMISENME